MSTTYLVRGLTAILKGIGYLIAALYVIPLPFVPTILNALGERADMHYTKEDMQKHPFSNATLGWVMVFVGACFVLPVVNVFRPIPIEEPSLPALMLPFGFLLWIVAFFATLVKCIILIKRLTAYSRGKRNLNIDLSPEKLTA